MKLDILQKIGIGLGSVLILYILASTILKKQVSLEQIEYVKGQVESIERFKLKNKWSVSYDIKLINNSTKFKVLPEYYNCYNYQIIDKKKVIGQLVTLGIDEDNGLRTNNLANVVSIKIDNIEYIDLDCVNQKIRSDKWEIPLIIFGLSLFMTLFYFGQKYLKKKK